MVDKYGMCGVLHVSIGTTMGTVAKYDIEGLNISYDIDGEILTGENKVLLQNEHNLIEGLDWTKKGYTIQPFPDQTFLKDLKEKVAKAIRVQTFKETQKTMVTSWHNT